MATTGAQIEGQLVDGAAGGPGDASAWTRQTNGDVYTVLGDELHVADDLAAAVAAEADDARLSPGVHDEDATAADAASGSRRTGAPERQTVELPLVPPSAWPVQLDPLPEKPLATLEPLRHRHRPTRPNAVGLADLLAREGVHIDRSTGRRFTARRVLAGAVAVIWLGGFAVAVGLEHDAPQVAEEPRPVVKLSTDSPDPAVTP